MGWSEFGSVIEDLSGSLWIMVHQRNRRIHSGHGFAGCFDAPWFRQVQTDPGSLIRTRITSKERTLKCAYEILKNIVENRASFTSEQVIVSYPNEILSQPLWKSYSYGREFLSFPTMWQRNFSFRNFLCLFPYFWNWIKNRPGARFSKLPVITGPVKLFCLPLRMGVSKVLKMVQ